MRWFLVGPLYPGILQALSLLIFGLVIYFALYGTVRPARNFATVVTWTLWWPILPLTLLLFGRAWCAVCPITVGIEGVQKVARPRHTPGRFLRRYGIWIMVFTFLLITWADPMWNIIASPRATGVLLLSLFGLAVATAWFYQRGTFCRYLCPIGALTGLYAMTSVVELRSKDATCQGCDQVCYKGDGRIQGCPLYEFPRTLDTNRNCNLCARCIKSCPRGYFEVRLRPPGRELWGLRSPQVGEAVLALLLVGLVSLQTLLMTSAWGSYMQWVIEGGWVESHRLALTLTFLGVAALAVGAYLGVSRLSSGGGSWRRNLASFGYAYIPLALAAHLGHNTSHLLGEGERALKTAGAAVASLLGVRVQVDYGSTSMPLLSDVWMIGLVILGGAGSLYTAWRVGKKLKGQGKGSALPHLIFLLVLAGLFIQLFLLPMNPRHSH
ncbi:MAG: 4Fe-4S binding protein [Chloroflexi bacterium]|nr:4Fe-4S binding protein [Chloroflexota bacterium]